MIKQPLFYIALLLPTAALADTPQMPTPKPSAELGELAGEIAGTWKCAGKTSMDGKTMVDAKATITNKLELDKFWIRTDFSATIGKQAYKFVGYTTFDTTAQKFRRVMFDNMGSMETNESEGPINHGMAGKWGLSWTGDSHVPGVANAVQVRHTESKSKEGLAMTGEMAFDGKTWLKGYEATCKK